MFYVIRYSLIIGIFLLGLTTLLSLIPLPELPEVPGSDKTHHFMAYGSVAFFMALGKPKKIWLYFLLTILWSGGIEMIQPYVNRHGEWLDLLANSTGVLIGWAISMITNNLLLPKSTD